MFGQGSYLTREQVTQLCALFLASVISALLLFGAFSLGSFVWDEQAEVAEVERLVSRIATESAAVTDGYFAEAERATDLASVVFETSDPARLTGGKSVNAILAEVTVSQPNVVATFAGFPDGSFLLARRDDGDSAALIFKEGVVTPSRVVTETIVDTSSFEAGDERQLPEDNYDPRRREW